MESVNLARTVGDAFHRNLGNRNEADSRLIAWRFPNAGKVKIYTDCSSIQDTGYGSYGGLARNDQGRWIEGFCGFIGEASVHGEELWGIKQGLKLVKERGWEEVKIDSDSKMVVELVNNTNEVDNHPERALIEACQSMKQELKAEIGHVLREGNRCADGLAKLGATQPELHVRILIPLDDVVEDLITDMIRISYPCGS